MIKATTKQKPSIISARARVVGAVELPTQANEYPELRYMGSKKRLLPWIHQVLSQLDFEVACDPFSGTGGVA
jgi:adenine-specific DNA-methyltransferase